MRNIHLLRSCALAFLALLLCTSAVSAYQISFTVPASVKSGETVVVNGESNIPAGFTTQIYLYRTVPNFPSKQVSVEEFTIQQGGSWQVVFDTTGWPKATYKLEIPKNSQYPYGTDSVTFQSFEVWDRSDEVELTSPKRQSYDGMLDIAGKAVKRTGGAGIQIAVSGPSGPVIGPLYIPTDAAGLFSYQVPISGPGAYTVAFSDEDGPIKTVEVTITGNPAITAAPTTAETPISTYATQAPLSLFSVLGGAGISAALVLRRRK